MLIYTELKLNRCTGGLLVVLGVLKTVIKKGGNCEDG